MHILNRRRASSIEPLEARFAPALVVVNPIPDIVAGSGKTGASVELSQMFDPTVAHPGHTLVTFTTNFDTDPNTTGIQLAAPFIMELLDDKAPLTVQNFLSYVQNPNPAADYTNTFFHRTIPDFVVQGGGFDASNPDKHIAVGPEVHNEFAADRSNVRGTVAMAKTGLGPNTATSEWFVNLKDNSANLDAQNGGFTVFGRVIQNLELFDKIALLQETQSGSNLRVQNYNPDPDNNPNTPPPDPTPNQLIRITDVEVTKPVPGNAAGTTFVVKSITDAATNAPTDLLTATIGGDNHAKLKLHYTPGKAGVANVTVTATRNGESVDDTFQVKVLPNLIANVDDDTLPKIVASGDAGSAVVKLTNNAAGQLTTNVDVKFYLSKAEAGGTDPNGTKFDPSDLLIGQLTAQPVSLAGGASADLTALVKVPKAFAAETGAHRLIVQVTNSGGSTVTELFTDDNNAIDGSFHSVVNQFGKVSVPGFGTRIIPKFVYSEADGDKVVLRLAGEGSASLIKDGTNFDLSVRGTDSASVLSAESAAIGERIELDDINIDDPIGTIRFGRVDSSGAITVSEGVRNLALGSLSGNPRLIIGAFPADNTTPVSIKLRSVSDVSLESIQPIASLTARRWLDTTGSDDRITAPALGSLNITGAPAKGATPAVAGDFEANVTIEGRPVSSINVAGFIRNATISLPKSNVGSVTLGGMDNADFFVGTTSRPDSISDFTQARTIESFTVGSGGTGTRFRDSQVAAASFGTIAVTGVDGASGSGPFGFVADKVLSYTRTGGPTGSNLATPQVFDPLTNYSLTVL